MQKIAVHSRKKVESVFRCITLSLNRRLKAHRTRNATVHDAGSPCESALNVAVSAKYYCGLKYMPPRQARVLVRTQEGEGSGDGRVLVRPIRPYFQLWTSRGRSDIQSACVTPAG